MKFLHLTVKDTGCNGGPQSVTSFLRGSKKIQLTPDNLNLLGKSKNVQVIGSSLACEQALLFGRVKRVSRERASERRSRKGQRKGELATIPYKFSFVLRPDEGKYHWLKNDVPEIKVD